VVEDKSLKYIMISPVRNEEKNILMTIKAVCSQTIRPIKWIIVDDGSSDRTPEIVEEHAEEMNWISLMRLPDRGYYDLVGGGEIKAFYKGYEQIKGQEFDFLVKLDGDISFSATYFEDIFKEFSENPRLGIAGGTVFYQEGEKLIPEKGYRYHVRGAARAYRRQCWSDIGGVLDSLSWDAVDVYKARMLGWETMSFENIQMIHHVKTWTKGGLIRGMMRSGRLNYLMGMHPLFLFAKVVRLCFIRPYMVRGLIMALGFIRSYILCEKRAVDGELMEYIRKEQIKRLFFTDSFKKLKIFKNAILKIINKI
jgi:poly-beta-1,6-N-acetyl-D-glucosamine synthase